MNKKLKSMAVVLAMVMTMIFIVSLSSCKKSETGKKATPAAGPAATQTAKNQPAGGTQAKPAAVPTTPAEEVPKKIG